jgi:hypothetical protein
MASRQPLIPRIAAAGTSFSPLPCQAWHGYRVIDAHRVEVEVGADGPASAPLSGVAAGGRPVSLLQVQALYLAVTMLSYCAHFPTIVCDFAPPDFHVPRHAALHQPPSYR